MAAQSFIKDNTNTQRQLQAVYVKDDSNTWRTISKIWVKDNTNTWQQVFGVTGSNPITFSTVGTSSYTVPAGVYNLNITYPTNTGFTTTNTPVTPGTSLTVSVGDYGVTSTVGSVTIPAYDYTVFYWNGNVDANLYQTFTAAAANAPVTVNAAGSNATLSNAAAASSLYWNADVENSHGDLSETMIMTPVPTSTLLSNFQLYHLSHSGRENNYSIPSQPTAGNSYRAQLQCSDGSPSEGNYTEYLNIRQQGYLTITLPTIVLFSSAGTFTWTAPAGVFSVTATIVGGGGGGGGGASKTNGNVNYQWAGGGGGGGAGGRTVVTMPVSPGSSYTLVVGAGGTGGAGSAQVNSSPGNPGTGSSAFGYSVGGGNGGGAARAYCCGGDPGNSWGAGGTGGTGNTTVGGTGGNGSRGGSGPAGGIHTDPNIVATGVGAGANGTDGGTGNDYGGGGGGTGEAGTGGRGGDGGATVGSPGVFGGGGGGGGSYQNPSITGLVGGNGGDGIVRLSF